MAPINAAANNTQYIARISTISGNFGGGLPKVPLPAEEVQAAGGGGRPPLNTLEKRRQSAV